jgi:16S rRNA processing protein RimM
MIVAEETKYVLVGKVGRPRGVDGSMFITPLTDFPERFDGLSMLYMRNRDQWDAVRITSMHFIAKRPVMKIEGVETPEEAARLTNRDLAVLRSDVVELPEDTFFVFDLIDCKVVDEQSGRTVGKISDVEQYPAHDVYLLSLSGGGELRVPAVKQFIKQVNIASRTVTVDLTGLID